MVVHMVTEAPENLCGAWRGKTPAGGRHVFFW